jgi:hypothetical protein
LVTAFFTCAKDGAVNNTIIIIGAIIFFILRINDN